MLQKTWLLNLGVRYEYSPPLRGGFNVGNSDSFGPFIAARQPMFVVDSNDFGPRAGIAWTPATSHRTVLRAGGAISYVMPQPLDYEDIAYISPALTGVSSLTPVDIPSQYLVFPTINEFDNQLIAKPSLLPADVKLSRDVADYNRRDTYVEMCNLTIQRQIPVP